MAFLQAWEGRAYDYGMDNLKSMGFPVDDLKFDPDLVVSAVHFFHNTLKHIITSIDTIAVSGHNRSCYW